MTEDSSKKMLAFFAGVVTAVAVMGLALYFVMANHNTQINALNAEITELKSQTADISSGETIRDETTGESTVDETADCSAFETVISFMPDTFTDSEKSEIRTKILEPYIYYTNNIQKTNLVSVSVEKYSDDERARVGYYYGIDHVSQNGGWGGWLEGKDGSINYWRPDCMGECTITDEYNAKFPNNQPTN